MENIDVWLQANKWIFIILSLWDLLWRLLAMWYSARQNEKIWFVALMLVNSVGLLPLAYLIFVSKIKFWEDIEWLKNNNADTKIEEAVIVKKRKK